MASINGTIILISIPAIFNGIHINFLQSSSLVYLLWLLMGYNIVTATLLVSFGRLSDIYGRVRLFNFGFMLFTLGSILLSLVTYIHRPRKASRQKNIHVRGAIYPVKG